MNMNRREFLILAATFVAGCSSMENVGVSSVGKEQIVDAGPANNYAADGVYSTFRSRGFFIVRRGEKLFALSAICTHKKCRLDVERDHSFYCPCHGSTFNPNGHLTEGPARRDLPIFATFVNGNGKLLVTVPAV
jgi:Rieske Fe-S protein